MNFCRQIACESEAMTGTSKSGLSLALLLGNRGSSVAKQLQMSDKRYTAFIAPKDETSVDGYVFKI